MLSPKRIKYRKPHRGCFNGQIFCRRIFFGDYGLQARRAMWLTDQQIESRRRVLIRYVRRLGTLWVRIFPDKIITIHPIETRIGSGKGKPEHWISKVLPGSVIFEISGTPKNLARKAIRTVASKLPTKFQFIIKSNLCLIFMVQTQTYLRVADNTGARKLICIRIMGYLHGKIGDVFVAIVKESLPNTYTQRSEVVRAVVARRCHDVYQVNSRRIRFSENAAVTISKDESPRGSRVFGPTTCALREKSFTKIISLSLEVL